jgi:hypothetical protein
MERPARHALGSAALLVAATLTALPAIASDSCLETKVTDVFVSPDGKVQGPGLVKICPHWTISPTLRLSRIYFNGRALGVWMLHSGEGGRFNDRDYAVMLRRLPEGKIALADYYWPGADGRPQAPGLRAAQLEASRDASATRPAAKTLMP